MLQDIAAGGLRLAEFFAFHAAGAIQHQDHILGQWLFTGFRLRRQQEQEEAIRVIPVCRVPIAQQVQGRLLAQRIIQGKIGVGDHLAGFITGLDMPGAFALMSTGWLGE